MSESESEQEWPLPKFSFSVCWGSRNLVFQEASGLDADEQAIEYKAGDSKINSVFKMPGLQKSGSVTLKRGVYKGGAGLLDWFSSANENYMKRETVIVTLLDEGNRPIVKWTLGNAWPAKITATDLKSDSNEVAIETIEIVFEDMTIESSS